MVLRNDESFLVAEPINGVVITPWVEDGDICINCGHEIRLVNFNPLKTYWFHKHTKGINCLESELMEGRFNV